MTIACRWRNANLARLLARRPDGMFIRNFEQGGFQPSNLLNMTCDVFEPESIKK
jgi:hypothetical protein